MYIFTIFINLHTIEILSCLKFDSFNKLKLSKI